MPFNSIFRNKFKFSFSLKVPSIRAVLDYTKCVRVSHLSSLFIERFISFVILFILFITAIEFAKKDRLITAEICFMIYALGFTLEKIAAMQEHGIHGLSEIITFLQTLRDLTFVSFLQGNMGTSSSVCGSQ